MLNPLPHYASSLIVQGGSSRPTTIPTAYKEPVEIRRRSEGKPLPDPRRSSGSSRRNDQIGLSSSRPSSGVADRSPRDPANDADSDLLSIRPPPPSSSSQIPVPKLQEIRNLPLDVPLSRTGSSSGNSQSKQISSASSSIPFADRRAAPPRIQTKQVLRRKVSDEDLAATSRLSPGSSLRTASVHSDAAGSSRTSFHLSHELSAAEQKADEHFYSNHVIRRQVSITSDMSGDSNVPPGSLYSANDGPSRKSMESDADISPFMRSPQTGESGQLRYMSVSSSTSNPAIRIPRRTSSAMSELSSPTLSHRGQAGVWNHGPPISPRTTSITMIPVVHPSAPAEWKKRVSLNPSHTKARDNRVSEAAQSGSSAMLRAESTTSRGSGNSGGSGARTPPGGIVASRGVRERARASPRHSPRSLPTLHAQPTQVPKTSPRPDRRSPNLRIQPPPPAARRVSSTTRPSPRPSPPVPAKNPLRSLSRQSSGVSNFNRPTRSRTTSGLSDHTEPGTPVSLLSRLAEDNGLPSEGLSPVYLVDVPDMPTPTESEIRFTMRTAPSLYSQDSAPSTGTATTFGSSDGVSSAVSGERRGVPASQQSGSQVDPWGISRGTENAGLMTNARRTQGPRNLRVSGWLHQRSLADISSIYLHSLVFQLRERTPPSHL